MAINTYTALDGLRFGVVDDNAYFRRLVRTMLTGLGVRDIVDATTPEDGWEMLLRHRPDVLLLDWNLGVPGGTGVTLLDRIRTSPDDRIATQAVVFLSAHSDRRHVLSAVRLGANDFIVKPVSARVLYDRVRRLALGQTTYVRRNGRAVPLPAGAHGGLRPPPPGGAAPAGRAAPPRRPDEDDKLFI